MYIVPILKQLPLIGWSTAKKWLRTLNSSPGLVSQGFITHPAITIHILMGTIIVGRIPYPHGPKTRTRCWAMLAVGPIMEGGGWILWVSQAALLVDFVVKLAWFLIGRLRRNVVRSRSVYARAKNSHPSTYEGWLPSNDAANAGTLLVEAIHHSTDLLRRARPAF